MTDQMAPSCGTTALLAGTENGERPVDVSVVIPTMRREAFLPALVERLFGQTGCGSVRLEVVIVDNCPNKSARGLVDDLRLEHGAALRSLTEKRPGVSHVRNTGVAAAAGSMIGFIDDDELPDEGLASSHGSVQATIWGGHCIRPRLPALR